MMLLAATVKRLRFQTIADRIEDYKVPLPHLLSRDLGPNREEVNAGAR
jgi:hypothetical protein